MFYLRAPWPYLQTTTILPNPEFGDQESLCVAVNRKMAIDGTRYVYVKDKGRHKLRWEFKLRRNKGLELRAFIQSYFASKIQATDHNGRVWLGNFMDNPFEFETTERAAPAIAPMPRGELMRVHLDFEGVQIVGTSSIE